MATTNATIVRNTSNKFIPLSQNSFKHQQKTLNFQPFQSWKLENFGFWLNEKPNQRTWYNKKFKERAMVYYTDIGLRKCGDGQFVLWKYYSEDTKTLYLIITEKSANFRVIYLLLDFSATNMLTSN